MLFAILAALAIFPAVTDKRLALAAFSLSLLLLASLPFVGLGGMFYKTAMFWSACTLFEAMITAACIVKANQATRIIALLSIFNIIWHQAASMEYAITAGGPIMGAYPVAIIASQSAQILTLFAFSPPAVKLLTRILYGKPPTKDYYTWTPKLSSFG